MKQGQRHRILLSPSVLRRRFAKTSASAPETSEGRAALNGQGPPRETRNNKMIQVTINSQGDDDEPEAAVILVACGVGLLTGAGVVLFNDIIHTIRDFVWHGETVLSGRQLLAEFSEMELWPRIVIPPVLGGLFVGLLGAGVGGYQVLTESNLNAKLKPLSRAIAAAITLGTGASLGPEGPSVDIGRSCAQTLGRMLKSWSRHTKSLLAAGSGAGVAAGFNAPIAGVFFAVETIMMQKQSGAKASADSGNEDAKQDSAGLTIAMVLLASVLAALVSQAGLGSSPAFRVPEYRLESLYELPLYLLFGAICGAVSASFSYSARVTKDAFEELRQGSKAGKIGEIFLPALGGLTTGVLGLGYPEILYQGFDNVNSVLASSGDYAPGLLLQIVVLKIIATTISRGSGLQGGIYAPSIFIGAALGSAFGLTVHAVAGPSSLMLSAPQAYALVGVAAMLASNCGVPLTSVLLLFELTRDYLIIIPTLGAVGISYWISSLAAPAVERADRPSAKAIPVIGTFLSRLWVQREDDEMTIMKENGVESPSAIEVRLGDGDGSFAECAVDWEHEERRSFLVNDNVTLSHALLLMEDQNQNIATIVNSQGEVLGVLCKDGHGGLEGHHEE